MIPSTWPWYRRALTKPHKVHLRLEVWRAGIKVDSLSYEPPTSASYARHRPAFSTGSVRATYGSRVTRTLQIDVPDFLYPWDHRELLTPFGNEIRAWRGIEYGDGSVDEFPVFRGPITVPQRPARGRFTLNAADRAYLVLKCGFWAPRQANVGTPIVQEIEQLITEAVPDATFGPHDTFTETVPPLAYDADRGAALDNLCKAASAVWYCLSDGRFVVRRAPWAFPPAQAPLALTDGPGGTLREAYPSPNPDAIWNRVTVTSERPDGGPAKWATADDTDPNSPTYVGGPFGVRATQFRSTGALTQDQLYREANALVQRSRALATAWQYTLVPDASIELGDLLASSYRDRQARQYVAGFTLPLNTDGNMTIDGHDLIDTEVDAP